MPDVSDWSLEALQGIRQALVAVAGLHTNSVIDIFVALMLFLVLKLVLRKTWLAAVLFSLLSTVLLNPGTGSAWFYLPTLLVMILLFFVVLFRLGFLALVVAVSCCEILSDMPLTFALANWYGHATWLALGLVVGVAAYAFRVALGGRPLFRDGLAGEGAPVRS